MIKRSILFLLLSFNTFLSCNAVTKEGVFLAQGTAWVDGFGYEQDGQYKLDDVKLFCHKVVGDTIINDKSYYRICRTKRCMATYKHDEDEEGHDYVREKILITENDNLHYFMREDETGDVWFYTDNKNVFEDISHNSLYEDFAEELVCRDLFLFNAQKAYTVGEAIPLGVIAFDSPNGFKEEGGYWDIYPYPVETVDELRLLDGKIYERYNKCFLKEMGPLNGPLVGIGAPNSYNTESNYLFAFYRKGQLIYRNNGYLSALEELFPDILSILVDEKVTTIDPIFKCSMSISQSSPTIYDLSGRKMVNGKLPNGLYIMNGKKVAIK